MQKLSRALLGLVPAAFVVPINASAPRIEGVTIVINVTAPGQAGADITFKVAGEKMRLEADAAGMMGRGGGAMAEGMYMLPSGDGKVTMVLPNASMGGAKGMAMTMDLSAAAARGGANVPSGDVVIEDLGAGESILGHATHKYRIRPTNGDPMDAWFANDIAGVDYKRFATAFGARFTGADAKSAPKMPSGFPLKIVGSGQNAFNFEVKKVEKTSFSDADFEVPPGVQVMNIPMGGRGRGGH